MEKVSGQKYLYQCNGIYYFRLVIPVRYRNYFQESEIRETLATSNLRDATSKICKKIVVYNNTLELVDKELQLVENTHSLPPKTNVSKSELDKIARPWFFEKQEREDIRLAAKRTGYVNILSEEKFKLGLQKEAVGRLETKTLYALWIIDELLEKNNINLETQLELKDYFEDLINRGLLEIANRNVDMLDGTIGASHDGLFDPMQNQLYMDNMKIS